MKCASKGSFVSSNTTLHYIDTIGHYRKHVIGDVKFNQTDSTQWIIQLDALDGGVQGIVGLSNTNWGSVLTLTLGDVCLQQTVVAPYIGDVEKSRVPIANMQEPYTGGLFGPSWESLSQYQVPEWFRNAKFGIWAHWGRSAYLSREIGMPGICTNRGIAITNIMWSIMGILRNLVLKI